MKKENSPASSQLPAAGLRKNPKVQNQTAKGALPEVNTMFSGHAGTLKFVLDLAEKTNV
ncbi:MAG: hypothetical protein WHS88_08010 [Anaerohalosphaeraceae bacterium]